MWFDYVPRDEIKMQDYLQPADGHGDINIDLPACEIVIPTIPDCPNMAQLLEFARNYRKDNQYNIGKRQWYKTM